MPPCTASRWPSSDEPTPNGITGTACSRGQRHRVGHVVGAFAEHHRVGRRHLERRLVAAVLFAHRLGAAAALAEAPSQRIEQGRRHRAAPRGRQQVFGRVHGSNFAARGASRWPIVGSIGCTRCAGLRCRHGQPLDPHRHPHRRRRHHRPGRRRTRRQETTVRVAAMGDVDELNSQTRRAARRTAARRRARAAGGRCSTSCSTWAASCRCPATALLQADAVAARSTRRSTRYNATLPRWPSSSCRRHAQRRARACGPHGGAPRRARAGGAG